MGIIKDITDIRFGNLISKIPLWNDPKNGFLWLCECDCGNEIEVYCSRLMNGGKTSCGCQKEENLKIDLKIRMEKYLQWNNNCLEWIGPKSSCGYGLINYKRNRYLAHRAIWIMKNGEIPYKFEICHKCDNPSCCNLDHLFLGTHDDNMKDMVSKKRLKGKKGEANTQSKLTEDEVKEIRKMKLEGWYGTTLAKKFNVTHALIYSICNKKSWKHI